jgi:ATP-dependent helicase/DNAse subunit B
MANSFDSIWVSHSSLSDFLKCKRAYWLKYVYKNPATGRKMSVMTPPLALGQAVHDVIDSIAPLPVEERLMISLVKKLDTAWLNVTGKKGGFKSYAIESEYRERAVAMLKRLEENPGILLKKAIKIKAKDDFDLPRYDFSEKDGIILCGKIDWLSYDEESDSVHIYDFKTGKHEEDGASLQLPIYLLLATNTQTKKVTGAAYWYLDREDGVVEKELPDAEESYKQIRNVALLMREIKFNGIDKCERGGCMHCRAFERIYKGEGELVGVSNTNQDIYYLAD